MVAGTSSESEAKIRTGGGAPLSVRRVLLAAALAVGATACGGGGDGDDADDVAAPGQEDGASPLPPEADLDGLAPEDVADVTSVDRRPVVLSELGGPDAFVITVDEVAGELSRFESWSYLEAGSQIDFVDGEVLWDAPVDDVPSGSLLPLAYSPMEFEMLASVDETLSSLTGIELAAIDVATAELEVDGAQFWAGEQLALGFVDDALVYVEAFALAGVEPEEVGS